MGVVRLTASNYIVTGYRYGDTIIKAVTVSDIENAYTNTDSTTYCSVTKNNMTPSQIYFIGFDFNQIPSNAIIDSVEYKFKGIQGTNSDIEVGLYQISTSDGILLSESTALSNLETIPIMLETIVTLEPFSQYNFNNISSLGNNFAIGLTALDDDGVGIFGMEITVSYSIPGYNKLIVNGETKFDLTEDTVTEEDVLSGINFHLPNGVAAIGTLGGTSDVKTATYTPSSNSSTATFSVTKEPIMFACIATSQLSQTGTRFINTVCSDGTSTHRVTCYRSSSTSSSSTTYTGYIYCGDSASITWSYTNGVLTITSSSTTGTGGYFASGVTYTLFYI